MSELRSARKEKKREDSNGQIGMMPSDLMTLEVILEPLIVARCIARNVIFLVINALTLTG